jgi:hypothetical protein
MLVSTLTHQAGLHPSDIRIEREFIVSFIKIWYNDSDWPRDLENCIRVTGFIIYLLDVKDLKRGDADIP